MRGPTARLRRGGIEIKRGARNDPGAPFRFRHAGLVPASKEPRTLAPLAGWMPDQVRHDGWNRSEEHTSELQSLMRSSYAVFCLHKNKQNTSQQSKPSPTRTT